MRRETPASEEDTGTAAHIQTTADAFSVRTRMGLSIVRRD